jgi:curved DNA-binding protein CbpA
MNLEPYEPESDYYSLLEVSPSAPELEIKRAFYRAIRKVHPDLNAGQDGSNTETQRLNRAKILLNAELRVEYDRLREDYWAAQRPRPSRRRRIKSRRRARRSPAPRTSKGADAEAWTRLAMAFLQGLMSES